MKRISLILIILGFSWEALPQEPVSLPPCITQLEQSQSFFQEIICEQIAKDFWGTQTSY